METYAAINSIEGCNEKGPLVVGLRANYDTPIDVGPCKKAH